MSEVVIYVEIRSSRGSEAVVGKTGYQRDEWDALAEEDRKNITDRIVSEGILVWDQDE